MTKGLLEAAQEHAERQARIDAMAGPPAGAMTNTSTRRFDAPRGKPEPGSDLPAVPESSWDPIEPVMPKSKVTEHEPVNADPPRGAHVRKEEKPRGDGALIQAAQDRADAAAREAAKAGPPSGAASYTAGNVRGA